VLAPLRQRDFALLWAAGFVSVAGDFALIAALPLHAYALTGSAIAAGGVLASTLVPSILLGSVAGVFVDRWDRKRTMVAADLLRAALLLPLLAVGSVDLLWLLYAVRAAVGTTGLFFNPAENALLPRLVGDEHLVAANALNSLNNNLGRLVGPAVGGVLYAWVGIAGVALADAATFLVSGLLVALIRADARPDPGDPVASGTGVFRRTFGEWRDGLRLVRRDPVLRTVFLALGLGMAADGTFGVGFAPLAIDVLEAGATGAGLLLSAQAVGGLVAGALVAAVAKRVPPRLLFGGGLVGLGLADLGLANAGTLAPPGAVALAVAAGFLVLAGFPAVALDAAGTGLVQTRTDDAYRGRVFGAMGAAVSLAILVGVVVAGPAVEAFGVVPVMSAGAAMWIVGGVFALVRLPPGRPLGSPAEAGKIEAAHSESG
jgi:MFS family permease